LCWQENATVLPREVPDWCDEAIRRSPLRFRAQFLLVAIVSPFCLAIPAVSHAIPQGTTKTGAEQQGFTWTEAYEGSGNSDGFVTDLNSTIGYTFGKHFAVDMGVPYFFVAPRYLEDGHDVRERPGKSVLGFQIFRKRFCA